MAQITHLSFNQDHSCVAVATSSGFSIFTCEPFKKCYTNATSGIGIVEMLNCTSLLVLAGSGQDAGFSPRSLQVYNSHEEKNICTVNFASTVLTMRLNKKRLICVLETKVHIFDMATMKILRTVDTDPNPRGICVLSNSDDNPRIAFPGNEKSGEVVVFDVQNLYPVCAIKAHKSGLSALAFNHDGTLLATASQKGTVIRVFSVPEGALLHTFRRGTSQVRVYSLAFSLDSTLLSVTSSSGTVHIFRVDDNGSDSPSGGRASAGTTGQSTNVGTISDTLSNMWDSTRKFAHIRLGRQNVPHVCAISKQNTHVYIATYDGQLQQYTLDTAHGGECQVEKAFSLAS